MQNLPGPRLLVSIGSVAILGLILFGLYRWRIVHESNDRKRLFYIASAVIIVIAALIPYSH